MNRLEWKSLDGSAPTLSDIYTALKDEYDGKLFSDNFIRLNVDFDGSYIVVTTDLDKPDDLDMDNRDDREWWQDKIDSTSLLCGEVVQFLVDKYGEVFSFGELHVGSDYASRSNYKGAFIVDTDQDDEDSPYFVTIEKNSRFNESVSYGLMDAAELEKELDKELDDGSIKVGDILCSTHSWDYDTHPCFYKVCQVKKSTILIQRLRSKCIGGHANTPEGAKLVPDEKDESGETIRVRVRPDGSMKEPGRYGSILEKWDGKPEREVMMNESLGDSCSNIRIVGSDEAPITLQNICPFCNKPHTIEIDMDEEEFSDRLFNYRRRGELIQSAFPMLDSNQREFIKTGICPKCWEDTMGGPEGKYDESTRKMVKESYDVSPELADRLNSILADEFLAAQFYRLAELAMKGKKQNLLTKIADENGEDELEDHFKNLSEWMQSKGIRVVTNHDEMLDITNATVFTVEDGDSTKEIVDKLIQSEEEAIEAYENLIPETDLDLHTMLCGFLKDEREHLKALKDARDEMGGSEAEARKPKHTIYESDEEDLASP